MSPLASAAITLLGFDYGERKIGVALGNTVSRTARPLTTLEYTALDPLFARIQTLIAEWGVQQCVVGHPLDADGADQRVTLLAERFARRLRGRFGLPVHLVDERYSSLEAQAQMRAGDRPLYEAPLAGMPGRGGSSDQTSTFRAPAGHGRVSARHGQSGDADDAFAAAIILRQYLNEH